MIYDREENSLRNLAEVVANTINGMKPHIGEFDSIAVRGMSGALVGSPVALALGRPLVVIRKPGDSSHAGLKPVGASDAGARYVFLDDFVCTGTTRREVRAGMTEHTSARYVGTFEYSHGGDWTETTW